MQLIALASVSKWEYKHSATAKQEIILGFSNGK